jgi:uncharacterized membrane protein (DUF441 family)
MDRRSYLRGIGVGLIIAWVTSGIAYLRAGASAFTGLVLFQIVLSALFLALSFALNTERKSSIGTH